MIRRRFMNNTGGVEFNPDNYLTIEALEDNLTVKLSTNSCQYSTNGVIWTNLAAGTATPPINTGEKLYFKATGLTPTSSAGIGTFTVGCYFNLSGNCMSMLFGDEADSNLDLTGKNYAFCRLFYGCNTLKSVSTGFLPATTLADSCYYVMFYGCTKLTTAPDLPAVTLAENCYRFMFQNCTGLTTAPELPATTLTNYCYQEMFQGCTGLTTAPELPATTLKSYCYQYMFKNCSKLNYIKAMFTTAPSSSYTGNWVSGVASTGTFVKNAAATWNVTGVNGVPSGWTITTETVETGGGGNSGGGHSGGSAG